jgi:hypothetical protein
MVKEIFVNVDAFEIRMISVPAYRFTTGAIHDAIGGSRHFISGFHVVISDSWQFISGFLDFISDWHFGASCRFAFAQKTSCWSKRLIGRPQEAPNRNRNPPSLCQRALLYLI